MDRMIFKPAARYPADPRAVFILAISVFSGITALALRAGPGSLEEVLPRWAVFTWGVLLVLGSVITLIGMAFQTIEGIITEQIGSVIVGVTTGFYSAVAIAELGPGAIQTVGIILAWGVACFVRWAQLQILISNGIKRAQKRDFLDRLEIEIQSRVEQRVKDRR